MQASKKMVDIFQQIDRANSYSDLILPVVESYRNAGEHWSLIDSLSKILTRNTSKHTIVSLNSWCVNCMFHKNSAPGN